jgi:hypothetical protein
MKLLFLCTCLELGRDGVGDYTRLLAEACAEAGHQVQLIALNDDYISRGGSELQRGRNLELPCLRLSPHERWDERFAAVETAVREFNPDCLSWQIVPYGFQAKGLMPPELNGFGVLGKDRTVHVMLHEIWIGISRGEPIKNIGWGALQKRRLLSFLRALSPSLVHTSNVTYQTVLTREGCVSQILPLFGNIPVTEIVPRVSRRNEWIGGFFGTIHPQLQPIPCFDILVEGARASGRKLRILGVGRLGRYGEELFASLKAEYSGEMEVVAVGEKEPIEVSRLLQTMDFGIAAHPWALAGKSGAVAAMLDHGLPIVVPRDDWMLRVRPIPVPPIDPLLIKLSDMPPELMAGRIAGRQIPHSRLPAIAEAFISSIEGVSAKVHFDA